MDVTIYGICKTGLQREINQDRIFYDVYSRSNDISAIAVAADGMGGHKNGEKASGYICDIIRSWWLGWVNTGRNTEFNKAVIELNTIIKIANREIYDNFQADGLCGTTISILFISHGKWHLTSVGDTRCYRLRQGILKPQLEQLNNDDTWENDPDIKRKYSEIELKNHPDFGKLTKAIGAM